MNTIKKIMFMSGNNTTKGIGILKLEKKDSNVFCNLKTYHEDFKGNYILGLKLNNRVVKQNINLQNNSYNFISQEIKELDDVQGCVLIEQNNSEFKPLLWGNNKDKNYKTNIINSLRKSISNISKSKITESIKTSSTITLSQRSADEQEKIDENHNTYTKQQNDIEKIYNATKTSEKQLSFLENKNFNNLSVKKISKLTSQQKLTNNEQIYHPIKSRNQPSLETLTKISLEEEKIDNNTIPEIAISCASNLFESDDKEVENIIDEEIKIKHNTTHEFYNMIKEQLDELFERYPPEENLNQLIENSSWVKIDTDIVNKHYVVGIIMHNNDIKYICYGVPGNYNIEPPAEMHKYSQWLPTNISDPYNNGYWVMYQDSDTGENILIS